eukprot:IDg3395t1
MISRNNAESDDLHHRCPKNTDWAVVEAPLEAKKPIMYCRVKNQAGSRWLLSDAVHSCANLVVQLRKLEEEIFWNQQYQGFNTLEGSLDRFKTNISRAMRENIAKYLDFLNSYNEDFAHCVLAMVLDPRYLNLSVAIYLSLYYGCSRGTKLQDDSDDLNLYGGSTGNSHEIEVKTMLLNELRSYQRSAASYKPR